MARRRERLACSVAVRLLAGCATSRPAERPIARLAADVQAPLPRPLSLGDIVALSRAGVAPEVLLHRLRASGWDYRVSEAEAEQLHEQGVDRAVIALLSESRRAEEQDRRAQRAARHRELALSHMHCPSYGGFWPYDPLGQQWSAAACPPAVMLWR